jgi:hypothetical protein
MKDSTTSIAWSGKAILLEYHREAGTLGGICSMRQLRHRTNRTEVCKACAAGDQLANIECVIRAKI